MSEPREFTDYTPRHTKAARRVLIDVQQVLASFRESIVLVGGWVPDLLILNPDDLHVGSMDVDLALDTRKLQDNCYADLLELLLNTGRYTLGKKPFQLQTKVDLKDGLAEVVVDVDFLASKGLRLRGRNRIPGFRVLQAEGCSSAFRAPVVIDIDGEMIDGVRNTVQVRVVSLPDFLVMKSHALGGRDKPKDAYDIVYCLRYGQGKNGFEHIAAVWRDRVTEQDVCSAISILSEKFAGIESYGPQRAAQFLGLHDPEEREIEARRAFELVKEFLRQCTVTELID